MTSEIWATQFLKIHKDTDFQIFQILSKFFTNISETKYHREAVLYWKWTGGYHLSPGCSFYMSWVIMQQKWFNNWKKHKLWECGAYPQNIFEFYKLYLGFYKPRFLWTSFVLMEKLIHLCASSYKCPKFRGSLGSNAIYIIKS